MIIDRFTKLGESKRKKAAVLAVVAVGCVCYYVIVRGSVVKLKTATAKYNDFQTACAEFEDLQADLASLQEQLKDAEKQLQEHRLQSFSGEQALLFFENINAMALAHNLKPVSRVISKPRDVFLSDKTADSQQQFVKTQSASVTVSGGYFDIIDFMDDLVLTGEQRKVYITNMNITLARGENFYPKASFDVILLIDSSESEEK
jgi:Tfp pilus assembly protein PilO